MDMQILRRLFVFAKPYIKQFYLVVFLTIALAVLVPLRPKLIQHTIDNEVAFGDYNGLVFWIVILLVLLVVQAVVQYFHTFMSGWLGQHIIKDIRVKLFRHIQNLRLKFFDNTPIGRLVTRNVSDIETLSEVFSTGIAGIIADILQLLVILGFMFALSWKLTLVSLALLPILLFATYVFKEKVKVSFNEVRTAVSNLNSFVQEHITGMSIVQIFNAEKREYAKFKEINKEHRTANIRAVFYYATYFPVAEIIQAGGIGLIIWYGAGSVIQEQLTLGVLIAFIMYIQMFFRPIRMIADRFNTLQMGIVASNRILDLMDSDEHIPDEGDYAPASIEGAVKFENVWFAYNDEDWVLKDINFEVQKGESLALVGATGAGKSSVINLLTRFYEINKGTIQIDGASIDQFKLANLRDHIAVVLQDVFLFSDTIYNNITLRNPSITLEKVKEAAELVGARSFIERLPGGFEYNVMERGATLSVGQRQLISFVRAMVYDPKIIILDEATSSVDTETEELIQEAIQKLMKGRTSIVIAHRLSTIQNADKILVLDKGEIKEEGTHDDLLELDGFYAQLHQMQYKEVATS
ncbi:ABC transporter ATP-binding protein [Marinoscillum furvescens]|uniref:ATP-binding cassette subfamily B protein n=1 Tax=Marinoscillum furvescens DSM 4134 TaxID=1122208 RepID=A0A3D9L6P7_MARFU|nr:ABC transporter ATP-binding protein [Marinoscillum furvescens]REE00580.1 ATP-binding cassette subfamily B protein [Marinoscillum furvescens DSM 4134]